VLSEHFYYNRSLNHAFSDFLHTNCSLSSSSKHKRSDPACIVCLRASRLGVEGQGPGGEGGRMGFIMDGTTDRDTGTHGHWDRETERQRDKEIHRHRDKHRSLEKQRQRDSDREQ